MYRLMPESALTAPKEKKLSGRQYFESGRHITVEFILYKMFSLASVQHTWGYA